MFRAERAFAAMAFAIALIASSCNCSNNKCGPANCSTGCCDSAGVCQGGFLASHCGTSGAACVECTAGQSCAAGHCSIVSVGGGSGTGGGSSIGGGSGTGGGFGVGGGGGGTTNQFCQSYASAYCDYVIRCGQADSSARSDCITFLSTFYCSQLSSLSKGYETLNQANANACISFIQNAACDNNPSSGNNACSDVVTPASGHGQGCFSSSDCTDPNDGCGGTNVCSMTCQSPGPLGAPCPCNEGLRCDYTTSTCANPLNVGEMCQGFGSNECVASAICDTNSYTCVSLPGAGSACYDSYYCAPSAYCDFSTTTCKPRVGQDQACTYNNCAQGLWCNYNATGGAKCAPLLGQGASCTVGDSSCQSGLTCRNNTCQAPGGVNAPCQYYSDCASNLECDSVLRTCQTYTYSLPQGASCTDSSQNCASPNVCRGAQNNPDGGIGTQGTCGQAMLGDSCTSLYSYCPDQAHCQLVDAGVGTCVASTHGSACGETNNCLVGDYCNQSQICVPKGTSGSACSGTGSCQAPLQCVTQSTDGGSSGLCGNLGGLNAACAGLNGCLFPYACINGFCSSAAHANEPCLNGYLCFNGACQLDAGTTGFGLCTGSKHADGESCTYSTDCQSGYCRNFSVCAPSCP